ncbi:hypothetical protein V6N11_068290 [Hibiscus sabdariffa]|uniref:RNase H type-1 domain-containing protein n=2 Tax=Hibiscus sabdariffa TaxID=183260 RepID=A0ABR2BEL5_9ROSI
MTTISGEWDWSRLNSLQPRNILDQIAAIPPPHCQFSPDSLGWRWNDTREFSTRSAYDYLMGSNITPRDAIWKRIWSLEIPQRVRIFLRTTIHQRNLTNVLSTAKNRRIWIIFFVDLLWKERCSTIFEPERSHREDLLLRGNRLLDECQHAFATTSRSQLPGLVTQRWSRPPPGWIKANVDASVLSTAGSASLGGVFRNEDGSWHYGFTRNIGHCSVLFAELWALHDCLSKAWSLNFRRLVIETDCMEVIRILKHSSNTRIGNNLIELIRNWTRKEWQLVIRHVSRNLNHVANRVAALGHASSREGLSLTSPPVELTLLVEEEKESSICERMISQDWSNTSTVAYFNMQSDPGGS